MLCKKYLLIAYSIPFQTFSHEIGHNLGLPDGWANNGAYPYRCLPDIGAYGGYIDIMNSPKTQGIFWSRCSAMDIRRLYMRYEDNWCMPGNNLLKKSLGLLQKKQKHCWKK